MQHCAINETVVAGRDTKRRNIFFMDREWEKFKGGPAVAMKDRIHVTINAKGMILLNANVHRLLGKPTAVNLYFNRQRDQIAVEPAHARLDLVFPVREKDPYFYIYASPFCKHFGIRMPCTQAFIRPEIDQKGVLLLDLSETTTVGGWTHKGKTRA